MTAETPPGGYDYVMVGAGSAGCVLAKRLPADPSARMLPLETGGSDRHPHVLASAGFLKAFRNPRFNWCCETEPGPGAPSSSRAAKRSAAPPPSTARFGCAAPAARST
jgi:choline dehydrogenase